MQLKNIKLSGFKSFVDSTTVAVPARIVGVVGPNGCGKSNVIDAIRWVMGESSAKTLRGESMEDVIFNGSTARKPVGKASVELVFDNNEGRAPGPFAGYNEIAIRRELSRDGQSGYFINKTKCRRRDITDIFLGTGLGPRSYSIIEQGMVGRIVEARPEELRVLIEEAAGVSRYKDRRRETETRIRHTRENLDRVADIRSELETQLRRLKRQSGAAERYKTLKAKERLVEAQLLSLRWRNLDEEVNLKNAELAGLETGLESKIAEQRGAERELADLRRRQTEANEQFNKVQAEYYSASSDIASAEQQIEHVRQTRYQQKQELERLEQALGETSSHIASDRERLASVEKEIHVLAPRRQTARDELDRVLAEQSDAEQAFNEWQGRWESFSSEAARPEQQRQVQQARITGHQSQIRGLKQREDRLEEAIASVESQVDEEGLARLRKEAEEHDELCEQTARRVDALDRSIVDARSGLDDLTNRSNDVRQRFHEASARLASLRELQAAAMGEHDETLSKWLEANRLEDAPRLTGNLTVEAGWERAVDRVLGTRASAMCVDSLDGLPDPGGVNADLFLVERTSAATERQAGAGLASKVSSSSVDLSGWLADVEVAEDLESGMSTRKTLEPHQSVVTRSGVWLGRNWIALPGGVDSGAGILVREKEIAELAAEIEQSQSALGELKMRIEEEQQRLFALEEDQGEQRRVLSDKTRQRAEIHNRLGRFEARALELASRLEQLREDMADVRTHSTQLQGELEEAQALLKSAESEVIEFAKKRDELNSDRDRLRSELQTMNNSAIEARESLHAVQSEYQRLEAEQTTLGGNISRMESQLTGSSARRRELESVLQPESDANEGLEDRLKESLDRRLHVESGLAEIRSQVEGIEESLRHEEQQRLAHEKGAQDIRVDIENVRISRQEAIVRRDTVEEQVTAAELDPRTLLDDLPENAEESAWRESLERIARKIERIGPVNLVAIEEYEEQAERKTYLDKQHEDLVEALATLESVIQKIDRETRERFRDTFDSLNGRFQEFFPRLFAGGSAYLELTDSDLLRTGVAVMARPPGKRNSTIHLLSGGEKALTAVALLFSFFDLNPAPFCVLDEVDAPLDDANVERYTELLKTLSERTQLIFITHNKITMESANILIGVTMVEPGVSRLVSVDVEEAVRLATI
ncbi:chromosome segregation protein SMC [Pseudomonadota bacterium]